LKIIFCLRNFLPDRVAGTEVYVHALSKNLQNLGLQCIVVKPGFDKEIISEYDYDGIRVIEYPQSSFNERDLIIGKKEPAGISFFEEILVLERPDIVHFHEISGSNGITIAHINITKKLGIPIFTTLHLVGYVCKTNTLLYKNKYKCDGNIKTFKCAVCSLYNRNFKAGTAEFLTAVSMPLQNNKNLDLFLPAKISGILSYPKYINNHRSQLNQIFSDSKKVFVLSTWFKKVLLQNNLPESKMVLMQKALPHYLKSNDKIAKKIDVKNIRFIYLGRISEIKGLHILIEALNENQFKNWSLDIYGQVGEILYDKRCRELAMQNDNKIFFKNILPPSEVISVIETYDVLVCPTIIEEMVGLVVMEAFAAGVPVIGSLSKGIAEQVTDGVDGFLFDARFKNELVQILENVCINPLILMRLKENIKKTKSFDIVAEQVYAEYKMV
jgi:glycosyltransferase involved in cell wall biosynthesis